ncbi:MAG: hypothetical protein ABIO43_12245 [Sphingomicrobium sp.]
MIKFRFVVVAALAGLASPAMAQLVPGQGSGPAPGAGNGAAMVNANRGENENYNRLIGKVGSQPVKQEQAKAAAKVKAVPAKAGDVVAGAAVRDAKGVALGTVESIDGDSAILVYSSGKIRFPLVGFGKDPQGLLISLSTQDFLALVAKAKSSS